MSRNQPIKPISEIGEYKFKKEYTLLMNIQYWSRRFYKDAIRHNDDGKTAPNLAHKVYCGVSCSQKLRFARMLYAIAKELRKKNE